MRPNRSAAPLLLQVLVAALAAAGLAPPAAAAEVELTPTVAYRSDDWECTGASAVIAVFPPPSCAMVHAESEDGPAYGAVLGVGLGRSWELEVLASRQETEIKLEQQCCFESLILFTDPDFTITHLQVGLAHTWGAGTVRPFAGFALGASRVEADDPRQRIVDFEEDAASGSLGAGVKVYLWPRVGLRLEGRGYWIDLPAEVGGDFTQSEAAAGLAIRF